MTLTDYVKTHTIPAQDKMVQLGPLARDYARATGLKTPRSVAVATLAAGGYTIAQDAHGCTVIVGRDFPPTRRLEIRDGVAVRVRV